MKSIKRILSLMLTLTLLVSGISFQQIEAYAEDTVPDEKAYIETLTLKGIGNNNTVMPSGWILEPEFSPDCYEYTITVNTPIRTGLVGSGISLGITSNYEDAIISGSFKNPNNGNVPEATLKNGVMRIPCLNADKLNYGVNTVTVTVTPKGKDLPDTKYKFEVRLKDDNRLMGLTYKTSTGSGFSKLLDPGKVTTEAMDTLSYSIDVTEAQNDITFKFYTCDNQTEVSVNGSSEGINDAFAKPKYCYEYTTPAYSLKYGENTFIVETGRKGAADGGKEYTITVNRAKPPLDCEFEIEGGGIIRNSLEAVGEQTTLDGYTFAATEEDKDFVLKAAAGEGLIVTYDIPATRENAGLYEEKVIGENGIVLPRPTYERNGSEDYYGRLKMSPTTVSVYVTKQDETSGDIYTKYDLSIYARMPDGASEVVASQSGPGQFVNSGYGGGIIVDSTLLADINTDNLYNIHSLGTFGGSMTYKFDTPIVNDEKNKYGVDFVVYGNSFGNAEAGAVSVSQNGETWYNLAGSEHYELSTDWDYSVTYNKGTENGKATTLASFTSESGAEAWLEPRGDMYWPMNSLHSIIGGAELGDSYTLTGVCTYDGKGDEPEYSFGYVDASPNGNVNPLAITVENPYVSGAQYMDISWAVDENGKPVNLENISYVKITNSVLNFSPAFGESSTEVGGISKVNVSKSEKAVGITDKPTSIKINGKEYVDSEFETSEDGLQNWTNVDLADTNILTLDVEVNGQKTDNIWINNQKTAERTVLLDDTGNRVLRVIVQNGEKEPVIYVFNFTGGGNPEKDASLDSVTFTPGDITITANEISDNTIALSVANNVEKIALNASALNPDSSMQISGNSLNSSVTLEQGVLSSLINIAEGENIFTLTVTSADNTATTDYTVKITRAVSTVPEKNTISVKFTFTGDALHGFDSNKQPLPGHEEKTWIASTTVEVPKGSTVKYLTDMMLYNAGIAFDCTDGTYISEVQIPGTSEWLGEFDNGANSGWMYRHNSYIASEGYAARILSNGDSVTWFYTDDYTKETNYESGWDPSVPVLPEDKSEVTTEKGTGTETTTTTPTEVTVSGSTATATVTKENVTETIKQATENKAAEIIVQVTESDTKGAASVKVQLDTAAVKDIVEDTNAALTVKTENGIVSLDQETLKTVISEAKGSTVTLEIVEVKAPTAAHKEVAGENGHVIQLVIKSGDKIISLFNEGKATVTVEIPAKLDGKKVAAIHIGDDGTVEHLKGQEVTVGGKKHYRFDTPHFSTFALVDADEIGLEVEEETMTAEEVKALIADLTPVARSSKTAKKNVKVTVKLDKADKAIIEELEAEGFTVKYNFYRSTKKSSKYKSRLIKDTTTYTQTGGKKGTKYYYKVRVQVYDAEGKLIARTALKQCRYASRTWSK
ncbi:MAG: cadherin-like beta sandwich domain-containing protein [Firmicutes bacterium]|nr:cadherin-like beta sandwich domain-containing protein [Bacillota bacterium]